MTPARAETPGSLLRSEAVVRAARRSGPADAALLDDAARDAIRLQEEIGLDVITDGEVRRVAPPTARAAPRTPVASPDTRPSSSGSRPPRVSAT